MPDDTLSTLSQIRKKVRLLTRSVSEDQLTTENLDQYINTFVLYDFPESLRLFNLHTNLTFYTEPYVDTYSTNTTDATNPLYNFKNKYTTVNPPAYVAGYQVMWSQSQSQFFSIYPKLNALNQVAAGDGTTLTFTGYVNTQQQIIQPFVQNAGPQGLILRNNVLFNSIDASGNAVTLIDYPVSNTTGALGLVGVPQSLPSPYGQINYLTGQFTVTFDTAPAQGQAVNVQVVVLQPTLPQAILFYDGEFTLRPVPDQAYRVELEAYVRPTELLAGSQQPEISDWWQYIAYGAAIKVLQDRMDTETVEQVWPEFKRQEMLVQRKTIVQNTTQRTQSIYAQQTEGAGRNGSSGYGAGGFNGGYF